MFVDVNSDRSCLTIELPLDYEIPEPIKNAVVKLIEIDFGKDGKKKRIPISHTITDKYGEFIFGPLCPGKEYAIDIWVNDVRHYNIDVKCKHEGDCLRGKNSEQCEPRCERC